MDREPTTAELEEHLQVTADVQIAERMSSFCRIIPAKDIARVEKRYSGNLAKLSALSNRDTTSITLFLNSCEQKFDGPDLLTLGPRTSVELATGDPESQGMLDELEVACRQTPV